MDQKNSVTDSRNGFNSVTKIFHSLGLTHHSQLSILSRVGASRTPSSLTGPKPSPPISIPRSDSPKETQHLYSLPIPSRSLYSTSRFSLSASLSRRSTQSAPSQRSSSSSVFANLSSHFPPQPAPALCVISDSKQF